jgi:hypothetical protein
MLIYLIYAYYTQNDYIKKLLYLFAFFQSVFLIVFSVIHSREFKKMSIEEKNYILYNSTLVFVIFNILALLITVFMFKINDFYYNNYVNKMIDFNNNINLGNNLDDLKSEYNKIIEEYKNKVSEDVRKQYIENDTILKDFFKNNNDLQQGGNYKKNKRIMHNISENTSEYINKL